MPSSAVAYVIQETHYQWDLQYTHFVSHYRWDACSRGFSWHYRSFSNTIINGSKSETIVQRCLLFNFCFNCRFGLLHCRQCTYAHAYMCFQTSSEFLVRYLSPNLSLLTNFQKLFTVSNIVNIVAHIFFKDAILFPQKLKFPIVGMGN